MISCMISTHGRAFIFSLPRLLGHEASLGTTVTSTALFVIGLIPGRKQSALSALDTLRFPQPGHPNTMSST